jgi:hypothetical protein
MRPAGLLALVLALVSSVTAQTPPPRAIPVPEMYSGERIQNIEPGSLGFLMKNPAQCLGEYRLRKVAIVAFSAWQIGDASVVTLTLRDDRNGILLFPHADAVVFVVIPEAAIANAATQYREYWKYNTELVLSVSRPSDVGRYVARVRGVLWRDRHGDYLASTYQYLAPRPGEGGGVFGLDDDEYDVNSEGNAIRRLRRRPGTDVRVRGYYREDGTYVRPHTRSRPGEAYPY